MRSQIPESADPQKRWQLRTEGPMLVVSVVFLVLFACSSIGKPGETLTRIADYGIWVTWFIFVIDYLVRLVLAPNKLRWFIRNFWELAILALPMFRALRILRVVPTLLLLQRYSAHQKQVTVALYTACGSLLLILVAALSIYNLEAPNPDSQINSFPDALWWSVVTVTTVGYGDIAPVSAAGRIVAAILMLGGIAIVGLVTATVAAWLVQQVDDSAEQDHTAEQLTELSQQVAQLQREIEGLRTQLDGYFSESHNCAAPASSQSTTDPTS